MSEFFTGVVSTDVGSWCLAVDVLHPVSVDERRRLRVERRVGDATTRRRSVDENVLRRRLRVLAAKIWYWSVLLSSHQQCLSSCTAALLCPILFPTISLIEWANPQLGFNDLWWDWENKAEIGQRISYLGAELKCTFCSRRHVIECKCVDYYWGFISLWVSVLVLISLGKIT